MSLRTRPIAQKLSELCEASIFAFVSKACHDLYEKKSINQ